MSADEHRDKAPREVRIYVITVSDTRTVENDTSGRFACETIPRYGHVVAGYQILKDEPAQVTALIQEIVEKRLADVIVTTGGTGISRRDNTYEAVSKLLDKRLDGFGELFRMLSYAEIGAAAMLSRAVAGLHRGVAVFATPGSSAAVKLALEKLILPEVGHLVFEKGR